MAIRMVLLRVTAVDRQKIQRYKILKAAQQLRQQKQQQQQQL